MRRLQFTCALVATALLVASCAESPTGRRQFMMYDSKELNTMGAQTFEEMKAATKVSTNQKVNNYVQCVSNALIQQTPAQWQQSPWEVVVFEDDQVNAFALPGGKIGVYTGLLLVAENQHQLAAVIGHEIAHVMAGHSNERLSSNQFISAALAVADTALGAAGSQYQQQLMAALGVGAQVGVALPFSRTHETEADVMGLELMAKAGFTPTESVTLWQNMGAKSSSATPQFLSSHPVASTRIKELNAQMVSAQAHFSARQSQGALPACGSLKK